MYGVTSKGLDQSVLTGWGGGGGEWGAGGGYGTTHPTWIKYKPSEQVRSRSDRRRWSNKFNRFGAKNRTVTSSPKELGLGAGCTRIPTLLLLQY